MERKHNEMGPSILPTEIDSLTKQPSLLVPRRRDVSLGGTSAPQRKQLHTDEVKFLWNLVRSSDCSTY